MGAFPATHSLTHSLTHPASTTAHTASTTQQYAAPAPSTPGGHAQHTAHVGRELARDHGAGRAQQRSHLVVLGVRRTSEGACESIRRTTRGLYRPLELHTRFCPTATGWRERLVAAGDFTAYEADWTLRPMADGQTGVELRILSQVNLMVPQGLLQSGTVAGVKETFRALLSRLVKP